MKTFAIIILAALAVATLVCIVTACGRKDNNTSGYAKGGSTPSAPEKEDKDLELNKSRKTLNK